MFNETLSRLEAIRNPEEAIRMAWYMKDNFVNLGVRAVARREACMDIFKTAKSSKSIDWEFINQAWQCDYRELQYVANDYLYYMKQFITLDDIDNIKCMIVNKSWWDTIDITAKSIGYLALKYPQFNNTLLEWSIDDNMWLKRTAIIHQLLRKKDTNIELLSTILINNLNSSEFFINKAIGWALRDYSKTDKEWIANFISEHKDNMATLSIREGSKYI